MDRNLRRIILKHGASLDVALELVKTTIQQRRPRLAVKEVYWPVFSMRSWVEVLLESYPHLLLGGFRLSDEARWRRLFSWFWDLFKDVDPDHPFLGLDADRSLAIPILLHGDEGRGLRSQAFMVESWQVAIGHLGPFTTNTSGHLVINVVLGPWVIVLRHSFMTRYLYTCISSKLYYGEKTLRDLNKEWARQLRSLYFDGVDVMVGWGSRCP